MKTIGELAEQTGIPPSKIRYYEKVGVLPPPTRTEAGYRLYDSDAVARLKLLRRGKLLGLNLGEIGQLLQAAGDGCCDAVDPLLERLLRDNLAEVDQRIEELHALRRTIAATLERVDPRADTQGLIGCLDDPCTTISPTRKSRQRETQPMSTITAESIADQQAPQGCCEPDCGPDTCGPTAEHEAPVTMTQKQAGCCEPDCGPDTCG